MPRKGTADIAMMGVGVGQIPEAPGWGDASVDPCEEFHVCRLSYTPRRVHRQRPNLPP